MDIRDTIKTGDVVMFSGNTPTGFLLKTFVSSEWNHSGIAVRFVTTPDPENPEKSVKTISLTHEGDLYILETNTGMRKDDIYGENIVGAGFSEAHWVFEKYNRCAVRRLHDIFRTHDFAERTLEFATLKRGSKFPSSSLPFLGVWLGVPLVDKTEVDDEMFCSELMAHYYTYTIGPEYQKITGQDFDGNLTTLFGSNAPTSEDMFTPGHYAYERTPNAPIFNGAHETIYVAYADMWYVILQPLLIIIFIMIAIWMSLPK